MQWFKAGIEPLSGSYGCPLGYSYGIDEADAEEYWVWFIFLDLSLLDIPRPRAPEVFEELFDSPNCF